MQRSECWNFTSPAPSAQEVPSLLEEKTSGERELAMSTPPCLLCILSAQVSASLKISSVIARCKNGNFKN